LVANIPSARTRSRIDYDVTNPPTNEAMKIAAKITSTVLILLVLFVCLVLPDCVYSATEVP
jgi:hypothetical protein